MNRKTARKVRRREKADDRANINPNEARGRDKSLPARDRRKVSRRGDRDVHTA